MCGICGISNLASDQPVDITVLDRMTDTLAHRGPDGRGTFVDGPIGLGHRRLSIIDLATGAQPMFSRDRNAVIVFNGEIYNYIEIRRELTAKGHTFDTSSDTEVLLRCYEEMGDHCVDALNGMFAFAIWDKRRRRLLLARDRLGEKPLYYLFRDGQLIFASELKSILEYPGVQRIVDPAALDSYLAYGYVPSPESIIEGVQKLPPGCTLTWERGRINVDRYWEASLRESHNADEVELKEELDRRLRESVRMRLRSDVPLGVFLSGGIDSSGITALACQLSGGRVKTFCVGFEEEDFSELSYARTIAEKYDTDHHEIIVRDRDLSVLDELVYHLDEPFADPSALPTYYVCREARRHVTVCLSGDAGDELFAGYTRYLQAAKHEQLYGWLPQVAQSAIGMIARKIPSHVRGRGLLERMAVNGAERYSLQVGLFNEHERRQLFNSDCQSFIRKSGFIFEPYFAGNGSGESLISVLQEVDQKTYLPDDILVKVDRASMHNSLEVRVPLLDHTLVEFVNGMGVGWKLRGGVSKYILKRVLEPLLPADLIARPKMGFGVPLKHWFRGEKESYARDILLSSNARINQWLSADAVRHVVDDCRRGGRDALSRKVWTLLVLEHWCRRFGI